MKYPFKNRKIIIAMAAIFLCTGGLPVSAYADDPSTNVWLDVIQTPTQARISVTVPLAYGFAVVGSVDPLDNGPVSVVDGNLLLSNVRVEVITPSGGNGDVEYEVKVEGQTALAIKNYSTDMRDGEENGVREGLSVEIEPYLVSAPKNASGTQHHWKPSAVSPTDADTDFKKFRMSLNGNAFSVPGTIGSGNTMQDVLWLENKIVLEGPPDVPTNGYTAAGTANIPSTLYLPVSIQVGGKQNQYKQIEESSKVSGIYWKVTPGILPNTP